MGFPPTAGTGYPPAAVGEDDRREAKRYEVWFPLQIEADSSERQIAVSHDASHKGLLVATPAEVKAGASVKLRLRLPGPEKREHECEGVIVRVERNPHDPDGPFGYHVAIEFDEEVPELQRVLELLEGE